MPQYEWTARVHTYNDGNGGVMSGRKFEASGGDAYYDFITNLLGGLYGACSLALKETRRWGLVRFGHTTTTLVTSNQLIAASMLLLSSSQTSTYVYFLYIDEISSDIHVFSGVYLYILDMLSHPVSKASIC